MGSATRGHQTYVRPYADNFVTPASGLTNDQVAMRIRQGRTNKVEQKHGRTFGQILRANLFTPFNALMISLLVVVLVTRYWQNGLFGFAVIFNTAIGVIQELRARRTLNKLAVINEPVARVVRDNQVSQVDVANIVQDDLLELRIGDQVVADGKVAISDGLEIDESLLTGESDPIDKSPGDAVRSGSIVVAGTGRYQATAIGNASYAAQLTSEAQRFSLTSSELRNGINKLIRWISIIMIVTAPIIFWRQWISDDNHRWQDAATGTVAALVGMVPDGLVLLTSMAFMLGVIALARRKTLVQELSAVEGLARVDVVCFDKTGTLTYGDIQFDRIEMLSETEDAEKTKTAQFALAELAKGGTNATNKTLTSRFGISDWQANLRVPFSSARKWSAASAPGQGAWVLGAPEMIFPTSSDTASQAARAKADELAAQGSRVLMLTHSDTELDPERGANSSSEYSLPNKLEPIALVVLTEHVRDDAAETLQYFTEQGVALKVISGDNPRTVGAVATRLGVPGVTSAADVVDARDLPKDLDSLAEAMEQHTVFGRVSPAQKRDMVKALQSRGHVVAMTGDGVNDALSLKDADIGVAMGSGMAATRAVAQLVLLDGKFEHLTQAVGEGRRVMANIERAANLFVIKNVYALVLALVTAITATAFPFEPIQMTMISALTIGIPGFFLALGPSRRPYVPGFLKRVLKFSVPVGLIIAAAAYAGFELTRYFELDDAVRNSRTTATIVVLLIALWTVLQLARPVTGWKVALIVGMAAIAAVVLLIPRVSHEVFLLSPTWNRVLTAAVLAVAGASLVSLVYRTVGTRDARDESVVYLRRSKTNKTETRPKIIL